jgi:tRNA/tmRNA/rRNA uracil-C5-methylase (TrmA/RlmC/RlmD family)
LAATVQGNPLGYRGRARLAVRGTAREPKIGLFQERSHNVVDIPRCLVHHPLVNQAALALKAALRETGTAPYHDQRHSGLVRYVQVVVERPSQTVQVVVVCNSESAEPAARLLDALRDRLGEQLHSIWFNGNITRHNVILGRAWQRWCGPEAVVENIGGVRIHYPPAAFGQANLELFEQAAATIRAFVPEAARIVEYHAGVGAIGLGLLSERRTLACVEVASGGLVGLELGKLDLPQALGERLRIFAGPSAEHVGLLPNADFVIVDPPRKGLEAALTEGLCQAGDAARLAYLSCGLDSFLRDIELLLASGRWRLSRLEPYAFFPFTEHVETLALLERA